MVDRIQCSLRTCPKRKECLRAILDSSNHQSYFEPDTHGDVCDYFIPITKNTFDKMKETTTDWVYIVKIMEYEGVMPTAVHMRKIEDRFCSKFEEEGYRKQESREECDSQFSWDPSPGANPAWKRTITSGRLNRLMRQAQGQPFVPRGTMKGDR